MPPRVLTTTQNNPASLVTTDGNAYPVMPEPEGGGGLVVPPLYSVVLRPGDTSGADNVFTTWAALYTACAAIAGGVLATIDDTLAPCVVPAGSYAVDGWTLRGVSNAAQSSGFSTLTLSDGAHFVQNADAQLRLDIDLLTITGAWTHDVVSMATGEAWFFLTGGAQIISTSTAVFLRVAPPAFADVFLNTASSLGDGTHFVVNAPLGVHNCFVICQNGSTLTADCVEGAGCVVEYDSTCSVSNTQGAGVSFNLSSIASVTEYTPGTAGNWNPAPNEVAAALDQLAAPSGVSELDAGQFGAGVSLTAASITKAKSGVVLILVAASIQTGNNAVSVTITLYRDGVAIVGAPVQTLDVATAGVRFPANAAWLDTLPDANAHTYTAHIAASAGNVATGAGQSGVTLVELT